MDRKRDLIYFEVMRIIACFFVIFNHTGTNGFFLCAVQKIPSLRFWCYLSLSIFCKVSVPLFLAISGALLLAKEKEALQVIWKRRILRMVGVLVIFSFLYYIRNIQNDTQKTFSLYAFFKQLYSSDWNFAYWYLYLFLSFLISLPFLRRLVKNLQDKEFYYMFSIALFFNAILPIAEYLLWKGEVTLNGNAKVGWLTSSSVLYPCLGYFLQNRVDIRDHKRKIWLLWILVFIGIMVSCLMTYHRAVVTGVFDEGHSQVFHSSFVLIDVAAVFLTVKYICTKSKIPLLLEKLISSVGSCTFGIYLLHMTILKRVFSTSVRDVLQRAWFIEDMLSTCMMCLFVMMIGYILVLALKHIPIIKNML